MLYACLFCVLHSSNFEAIRNNRLERDSNPLNSTFAVGLAPGSISGGPWRKALAHAHYPPVYGSDEVRLSISPRPADLECSFLQTAKPPPSAGGIPTQAVFPSILLATWQLLAKLHCPRLTAAGGGRQRPAFRSSGAVGPTAPGPASGPLAFAAISGTSFTNVWLWFDKGHQLFSSRYRFPRCRSHTY